MLAFLVVDFRKYVYLQMEAKYGLNYSCDNKFGHYGSLPIEFYSKKVKICNIECYGNKMHQIMQNMILSWV